ncbi:hypothetical protein BU204_00145 [Actinophytocola xanthii]|uniref:DUF2993 domain-containing protein n=1 Tax=Actinophytocola xanthii TaxID=1912961 RepID=A0A1Q8CYE8_9PSEU|nr:hypothetical protein BU204_00145 [Actinophytocola xanthii]
MRRWLVVAVAGLVVVLVAADRVAVQVVERRLAGRLSCGAAEVDVSGFPVLTQLVSGELDEVTVDTSRGEVRTRLTFLDLALGEDRGAAALRVVTTVPWATMTERMTERMAEKGRRFAVGPNGSRVAIVTGRSGVTVLAGVAVDGDRIRLEPEAVQMFGQEIPLDGLEGAAGLARIPDDVTLPLPTLPSGVRATGAEVTDAGLVVRAEGSDVRLSGGVGAGRCGDEQDREQEGA